MMADDDQLCALALAAAVVTVVAARDIVRKRKRKRLLWTRTLFQKRSQYGAYNLLMAELQSSIQVVTGPSVDVDRSQHANHYTMPPPGIIVIIITIIVIGRAPGELES